MTTQSSAQGATMKGHEASNIIFFGLEPFVKLLSNSATH